MKQGSQKEKMSTTFSRPELRTFDQKVQKRIAKEQAAQSTHCYLTLSHVGGNGNQLHSLEVVMVWLPVLAEVHGFHRFLDTE